MVAQAAGGGAESLGALALRFFFSVAKTLKMSCENSASSLSDVILPLTCKMCDSIISSMWLVEVLRKSK